MVIEMRRKDWILSFLYSKGKTQIEEPIDGSLRIMKMLFLN